MMQIYRKPNIEAGIYLPEKVLDNEELEKRHIVLASGKPLLAARIEDKIGVLRRHIASEKETAAEMGYKAVTKLAQNLPASWKSTVDLILVSSSHPTGLNIAKDIKSRLEISSAEVLDIHAACSGSALMFSMVLEKQKEMTGKRVLLVASEKFSNSVVDLRHPEAMKLDSSLGQTIFGDGAAAVSFTVGRDLVVHYSLNESLHDVNGKTDLILMAMGDNKFVEPCVVYPVGTPGKLPDFPYGYFTQNGPRVFEVVQSIVPELIRGVVKGARFKAHEIDLVVVHPGSKRLVEALARRLAPDFEVYSEYEDANMSSVSLLYSFIKAMSKKKIGKGSKVVLAGFGAGSPDLYSSTVVVELK